MRKELDDALCRRYPTLYKNRSAKPGKSLMHWGFSCGDGWYHIIDVISRMLTDYSQDITASQVKEKFGGLRFYYSGKYGEYTIGITTMGEQVSGITCEVCGTPSRSRNYGGYVSTMCPACAEKAGRIANKDDDADKSFFYRVHDLGMGWSRLVTTLESAMDFFIKHNNMPEAQISITRVDGMLIVGVTGGDDRTRGMVDFINYYADRIEEESGEIKDH